jgi:hypothetical protein
MEGMKGAKGVEWKDSGEKWKGKKGGMEGRPEMGGSRKANGRG